MGRPEDISQCETFNIQVWWVLFVLRAGLLIDSFPFSFSLWLATCFDSLALSPTFTMPLFSYSILNWPLGRFLFNIKFKWDFTRLQLHFNVFAVEKRRMKKKKKKINSETRKSIYLPRDGTDGTRTIHIGSEMDRMRNANCQHSWYARDVSSCANEMQ